MDRRAFIASVTLGVLTAPVPAETQAPGKVHRIGVLWPGPPVPEGKGENGKGFPRSFRQTLQERGYVEGQNITFEYRPAGGSADRLRDFAAELTRLNVDAIFAISSAAVRVTASATRTIPIVALDLETDPVGSGLAASLARPGGNVTGVFLDLPEMNGKWLQLLKEAVPKLTRVAILWDAAMDPVPLKAMEVAARSLSVQLHVLEVRGAHDFETAFRGAIKGRAGALIVGQSPLLDVYQTQIVTLAARNRPPTMGMFGWFVKAGGLMAYGVSLPDLYVRAASFVDRILKGATPDDLPIERPTKFELAINLKTAKALGLTIHPTLLLRANQVLE
jgi:putative ABC transport system substrate-binding protein